VHATGCAGSSVTAYLSICAIYRNEAPYLREWVEFHRLVGAERFFLYNNRSTDEHEDVLAPLIREGTVVLRDWPLFPGQRAAYDHTLREHRNESRWIAFIDIDEFLYSPKGAALPEVLADYEQWPGLGVNRLRFGTSGHRVPPGGLVIENYVHRAPRSRYLVKSVVDPRRTSHCLTAHVFAYTDGNAVDEKERPLVHADDAPPDLPIENASLTERFTVARLCINHYATRSEEEFRRKVARAQADTGRPIATPIPVERVLHNFNRQRDETLLRYVPALREAVQREP
jgi:hypothetical protein